MSSHREEWRDISDVPGFQISDWGRVRRVDEDRSTVFIDPLPIRGRATVRLNGDLHYLEDLMIHHWLEEPEDVELYDLRQLNRNWWDYRVENLRWVREPTGKRLKGQKRFS